jgi:hypothetical protein
MTPQSVFSDGWLAVSQPHSVAFEGWLDIGSAPVEFVDIRTIDRLSHKKTEEKKKPKNWRKVRDEEFMLLACGFIVGEIL